MALLLLTSVLCLFVALCAGEGLPTSDNLSIRVTGTTSSTMTLAWNQIHVDAASCNNTAYKVSYRTQDSEKPFIQGPILVHKQDKQELSATVTNLTYNTHYDFSVTAVSRTDPEQILRQYPDVACKTRCRDPIVPDNVLFIPSRSDSTKATIFVSHSPITEMFSGCDVITDIWLDYKLVDGDSWTRERLPVDVTTYTAAPSGGAGQYHVMVVVQNNAGLVDSTGIRVVYVNGLPGSSEGDKVHTVTKSTIYWVIIAILSVIVVFLSLTLAVFLLRRHRSHVKKSRPLTSLPHPDVVQSVSAVSVGQYLSSIAINSRAIIEASSAKVSQNHISTGRNSLDVASDGYLTPHGYTEPDEPGYSRTSDYLKPHDYLNLLP